MQFGQFTKLMVHCPLMGLFVSLIRNLGGSKFGCFFEGRIAQPQGQNLSSLLLRCCVHFYQDNYY